jgi:peptide/nickel transport system substrate-binding protein
MFSQNFYEFRLLKGSYRGVVVLSAGLIAILAGCRFSSTADHPPGYLVAGIESHPLHLDPRYATDANSVRVGGLIYNSLLRSDEHSRLRPELAAAWRMIDDRTYVFSLRDGVRFHDGTPLTAADVKYTYESIMDTRSRSPKRGLLEPLAAVEALDRLTVRFRLRAPHAPFAEQFTIGIVPAHSTPSPPPGSGPFILEDVDPGEQVTLRANLSYWEAKPSLPGIVFKVVPDATVRALEFKKGTIHFLQNDLEPDTLPWLGSNTEAAIDARQGTTFQYIGINATHPVLRQQTVRRALALAIDREKIIRHLLKGLATPANSLLSPLNWAYDESVPHHPWNPEQAKRLLDEAGYPDPDGDGPLPRFRLSFKTTNLDLRRRIAEALKEQLGRVGVDLELRSYEWGTFYGDIKAGNFHLYSLAWVGVMDPDIFHRILHSSAVPPFGDNRGRYRNPALDRLLEEGRATTESGRRKLVYAEVQRIVAEDLPFIPLWWVKNVVVQSRAIAGFTPYPDGELISFKNVSFRPVPPA